VWAGGSSFEEYGIHPVEMVVSCLGADVKELMWMGPQSHPQLLLQYADGRTGLIDFAAGVDVDYAAAVTTPQSTRFITVDGAKLFVDAAAYVLDFFEAGTAIIDRRETLSIHRILEVAARPESQGRLQKLAGLQPPHWRPAAAGRKLAAGTKESQS